MRTKPNCQVTIQLKDAFGFAQQQKKALNVFGYRMTLQIFSYKNALNHPPQT